MLYLGNLRLLDAQLLSLVGKLTENGCQVACARMFVFVLVQTLQWNLLLYFPEIIPIAWISGQKAKSLQLAEAVTHWLVSRQSPEYGICECQLTQV